MLSIVESGLQVSEPMVLLADRVPFLSQRTVLHFAFFATIFWVVFPI